MKIDTTNDDPMEPHLPPALLASFLDARLTGRDRETVVSHLASCGSCRDELALLAPLTREGTGAPLVRRVLPWATAAALLLALAPSASERNDSTVELPHETTRAGAPGPSDADVRAVNPPDGASLAHGAVPTFTWRAAGEGTVYLLTVQDAAGNVLSSTTHTDTVATIDHVLERDGQYFWSVDARRADGGSASSGVNVFTIR